MGRVSAPNSGNTKLVLLMSQLPRTSQFVKVSLYRFGTFQGTERTVRLGGGGARRAAGEAVQATWPGQRWGPAGDLGFYHGAEKPPRRLEPGSDIISWTVLKGHPDCFVSVNICVC